MDVVFDRLTRGQRSTNRPRRIKNGKGAELPKDCRWGSSGALEVRWKIRCYYWLLVFAGKDERCKKTNARNMVFMVY